MDEAVRFAYFLDVVVLNESYTPDATVTDGCLALNAIQRKVVRVSLNDDVQVAR